jgi:hypothetical protein
LVYAADLERQLTDLMCGPLGIVSGDAITPNVRTEGGADARQTLLAVAALEDKIVPESDHCGVELHQREEFRRFNCGPGEGAASMMRGTPWWSDLRRLIPFVEYRVCNLKNLDRYRTEEIDLGADQGRDPPTNTDRQHNRHQVFVRGCGFAIR